MARRSLCKRGMIGAVVVLDGEIVGRGYNAPPNDDEGNRMCHTDYRTSSKPKSDRTCCVHAEWRAIIDALRRNPDKIKGSTLYFTRVDKNGNILKSGRPYCTVCSRLALDSGISVFVLWHEEGIKEYPTDEYNKLSYQYLLG